MSSRAKLVAALTELRAESADLLTAIATLERLVGKGAKPKRKTAKQDGSEKRGNGRVAAIAMMLKRKPGMTADELVAKVKSPAEKKGIRSALYGGTYRKLWKADKDGGYHLLGE